MNKPRYDIDAPDQQRLKIARLEIEAILSKHDLAACVVLHTPGMSEFFYNLRPTYSVCWIDEKASAVRVKSNLERDHEGDAESQLRAQSATANMTAALAGELGHAARMFSHVDRIVTSALRAEHTPAVYVPDLQEGTPS